MNFNQTSQEAEKVSKKTRLLALLGAFSFWLLVYSIVGIPFFLVEGFSETWKKNFLTFFTTPLLANLIYVFSFFYFISFCFAAPVFLPRHRVKNLIISIILSILFFLPQGFFSFSLPLITEGEHLSVPLFFILAGVMELQSCFALFYIFKNKKEEKVIPRVFILSIAIFLLYLGYVAFYAKKAAEAEFVLEKIYQSALELKDGNFCEKMKKECKKRKISFPSGKCYYGYRDIYVKCVTDLSIILEDENLCKKIEYPEGLRECQKEVFLKTTDLCQDILEKEKKLDCIQQVAVEKNDLELCQKIRRVSECMGGIAVKTKNFDLCLEGSAQEGYSLEFLQLNCFKEVFRHIENPEVCNHVRAGGYCDCIIAAAFQLKNPELCQNVIGWICYEQCLKESQNASLEK